MIDARKIFADLQAQAETAIRDFDVDEKVEDAKRAAAAARERIETDPAARNAAMGVGGLLLAGLLGTKGGRNIVGGVAKTGAVAALGALAYKAWTERNNGGDAGELETNAGAAGFPTTADDDPAFATAILLAMLGSAYADGVIDAAERKAFDNALERANVPVEDRLSLFGQFDEEAALTDIAKAAKSPNHAAELYAAAAVMAQSPNAEETKFLVRLADRLGLGPAHAASIRQAAQG